MKKILIIVDYQTEFVNGKFGFLQAENIENNIAEKIKEYRKDNATITFTLDTHKDKVLYQFSGKLYSAKKCVGKHHEWRLFGEINELCKENDLCFIKSSFASMELFEYLRKKDFKKIELAGVSADICVLANAVIAKTACPRSEIIVDRNCIASKNEKLLESAINIMESMKIIVI